MLYIKNTGVGIDNHNNIHACYQEYEEQYYSHILWVEKYADIQWTWSVSKNISE